MASSQGYEVKLGVFEGPLDLLLHLIRKNEVDIFDIPISTITEQYLEYLDLMRALNISLAGDFVVMAATLIHIKSKMLLPPTPGEESEDEDPRIEITRPLLEYMRLKEVAGELSERDMLERDVFTRRIALDDLDPYRAASPLPKANLFQLIDAFRAVIERHAPHTPLSFRSEEWSLEEKMTTIMDRLRQSSAGFFELFPVTFSVSELVATFLALLELVQVGRIRIHQPEPDGDILLSLHDPEAEDAARA